MTFAAAAALLATALLLGGMVFFAAAVAPLVFSRLPPEHAGRFIRQLFPVYYLYLIGTAAAAAVALLPVRLTDALAMAVVAAVAVWLRQSLMPRINAQSDTAKPGFTRAHRLSVLVNLGQMLIAAIVLVRFVAA